MRGREQNAAREGVVGGEAGTFLILDLDINYIDVFSLCKIHKAVTYDSLYMYFYMYKLIILTYIFYISIQCL